MNIADSIKKDLQEIADPSQVAGVSRFFKSGKGEYGEGDQFLGIKVPKQKEVAKRYYKEASLKDIQELLQSPIHEHRLTALQVLCLKYPKGTEEEKKAYYEFYLNNLEHINNWDLVDLSAYKIVGEYLLDKDRSIIYKLAKTDYLWTQRVSLLTTYRFIKEKDFKDALNLAEYFISSKHDLIQKASGWMLKEIGKMDEKLLINFLDKHYKQMPRTMLRYCLEKLSDSQRKHYLS
ncbi:MAG: DNA alkylation repair protein [Candidatus Dojkabacteria bacterium]